ncbi:hypothetical protein ANN_18457 [Periplaneta americana]|uniref:Uncharacterized protein n=1 Tax=Periplaneta americana TaxID=6978 RepID=A0ABQ8SNT4_PERAM|nr:hypothetical protein ANN_18457 [Periplaneta americana]
MAGLCEGGNEPSGSLKAICNKQQALPPSITHSLLRPQHRSKQAIAEISEGVSGTDQRGGAVYPRLQQRQQIGPGGCREKEHWFPWIRPPFPGLSVGGARHGHIDNVASGLTVESYSALIEEGRERERGERYGSLYRRPPEAVDSLVGSPWNVVQRCWMASAMAPEADLLGGGVSPRTNRGALGEVAGAGMIYGFCRL